MGKREERVYPEFLRFNKCIIKTDPLLLKTEKRHSN